MQQHTGTFLAIAGNEKLPFTMASLNSIDPQMFNELQTNRAEGKEEGGSFQFSSELTTSNNPSPIARCCKLEDISAYLIVLCTEL